MSASADTPHAHEPDDDGTHCATCGKPIRHQLAGMALRNGVLVIGPTHWSATVRRADGTLTNAVRRKPSFAGPVQGVPGLRGAARLAEMVAVLPQLRRALPDARLPLESPRVAGSALATSIVLRTFRRRFGPTMAVELAGASLSLGLLLASLKGGEIAMYHGAEHKAIGGYEQGIPAVEASKEHERCGTQLAVPMMVTNVVAGEVARVLLPRRPQLAALVGSAAGIAASTELARRMQRGSDSAATRLTSRVGLRLQAMASTEEPTAAQLEVAEHALAALLDAERSAA